MPKSRGPWVVLTTCLALSAWLTSTSVIAADETKKSTKELNAAEMGSSKHVKKPVDPELRREFVKAYQVEGVNERELFDKYVASMGGDALLDYLEETFPLCHGEAHQLGVAIYASTLDLGAALLTCGHRCSNGCMHGVIREAFGKKTLDEVKAQLEEFCQSGAMSAHKPGNCAHSLGHALMIVSGRSVEKSLDACSAYPNKAMGYYCATGVYMEYFMEPPEIDPKTVSLHFPCDTQKLYPAACYRYQAHTMFEALDEDPDKFSAECLALTGARRLGCFHGFGNAYTSQIAEKPKLLAKICRYGTADDKVMCIEGAIEKLADMNESKATKACAKLSGTDAAACKDAVQGKMYRLDKPTMPLYTNP